MTPTQSLPEPWIHKPRSLVFPFDLRRRILRDFRQFRIASADSLQKTVPAFPTAWLPMKALVWICLASLFLPVAARAADRELWLDQRVSIGVSPRTFLLLRISERVNENVSDLFEAFVEVDAGFHAKPWLTVMPGFLHLRFNPFGDDSQYENRPQFTFLFHQSRGRWRPQLRSTLEGRFPEGESWFARVLLKPGFEYDVARFQGRSVVFWWSNEFGIDSRSDRFSRNRLQTGVSVSVFQRVSVLPYYLLESSRVTNGWNHDHILGLSFLWRR